MKKLFIVLLALFLVSCGSDSKEEQPVGLSLYEGLGFEILTPSSWLDLTGNDDVLPSITSADVVLAKSSPDTVSGYANNIVVLSHTLEKQKSSLDYALLNSLQASRNYKEYTPIKSKSFVFNDGEKSNINTFEVKYNSQTPTYKLIQTGRVCKENKAFFLTIGVSLNITDTARYEEILKTFKCKD